MSHWVKHRTSLKDPNLLKTALDKLGFEFTEGEFKVSHYGQTETVQFILDRNKAVGLSRQKDGSFAIVGDPYYAPPGSKLRAYYRRGDILATDIKKAYVVEEGKQQLEAMGFTCTENAEAQVSENGEIRMVFTNYNY